MATAAGSLLRQTRLDAGLTQQQLAERLGISQPEVARLEGPASSPTVRTLERVLSATGHRLELSAVRQAVGVDEMQLVRNLAMTPAQRLRHFQTGSRNLERMRRTSRRVS